MPQREPAPSISLWTEAILDSLKALGELRNSGVLSLEEYQKKRQALLEKL